jgi:sec-independent protein translocase protein TatA
MGAMQPWHIIVVVVVFLVLFGSKKLPDAARGLGRSMRIFKSEVSEMQNESGPGQMATPGELEGGSTGRATHVDTKSAGAATSIEPPTS